MRASKMLRDKRAVAVAILVIAAGLLASGVLAGQFRGADPEAFRAGLATGEVTRVADIGASDGLPGRGVFAQATDTGQVCLWDAPSAASPQRQGGCNAADDPLGGSSVSASLAYDGGPAVQDVRDARLIGLAAPGVAQVEVLMSDGSSRVVKLRRAVLRSSDYLAFGYRLRKADLRKGIGPVAVVARDAAGAEVARQETGIGG